MHFQKYPTVSKPDLKKKTKKKNTGTIDFNVLLRHEQWKDQPQVISLFPKENFSIDQSSQQLVYMSSSLQIKRKRSEKENYEQILTCKWFIVR
jgi:hypothetical protein